MTIYEFTHFQLITYDVILKMAASGKWGTNSLILAFALSLTDRFVDEYNDLQGQLPMPIQLSSKRAPKMKFERTFVRDCNQHGVQLLPVTG